jgi:hypothetical protein
LRQERGFPQRKRPGDIANRFEDAAFIGTANLAGLKQIEHPR